MLHVFLGAYYLQSRGLGEQKDTNVTNVLKSLSLGCQVTYPPGWCVWGELLGGSELVISGHTSTLTVIDFQKHS